MSQHQFQPLDAESDDGTKLVAELNSWVPAVVSQHAGTTRPAYLKQGSIWVDNGKDAPTAYMYVDSGGPDQVTCDRHFGELSERIKSTGMNPDDYWWYADLRRYGTVPHAGFGLGLERTVQFVTGTANIRDVIPFPRAPRSAEF